MGKLTMRQFQGWITVCEHATDIHALFLVSSQDGERGNFEIPLVNLSFITFLAAQSNWKTY